MSNSNIRVTDYSRALAAIDNNLNALDSAMAANLRSIWEEAGCVGLVRAAKVATMVFCLPEEEEALNSLIAQATNMERMIDQDIRSLKGGSNARA